MCIAVLAMGGNKDLFYSTTLPGLSDAYYSAVELQGCW
jgi:hypothetical protein